MIEPRTQREKDCYLKGYQEAEKAYGGCHFCYGRGYSLAVKKTRGVGVSTGMSERIVKPCECERGIELAAILPKSV